MAGNPASISAGIACLEVLKQDGTYEHLDRLGEALTRGLKELSELHGIPITINRICGAFSVHFCDHPVTNYEEAKATNSQQSAAFFRSMLDQGICLAPSKFEAWFLTLTHTDEDIEETLRAADRAFQSLSKA